ncbi:MAG: endonuclease/exonuclease/phosphatase family protein [Pseudomonadota bacterium]
MKSLNLAAVFCAISSLAQAEKLTVASWNIANLGEPGKELRGYDRVSDDYPEIMGVIASLGADVIAFQEIGSKAALMAVLPDGYSFQFETRCLENSTNCMNDADDIYNAIAVREELDFSFFQIDELAIEHQNECGDTPRKVRGGVGVDLMFEGQRYLIPSLHLKATCKDNSVEDGTADDCATQRAQVEILREWMDRQPSDATLVLAGDFNRKLLNENDLIRTDFFADIEQSQFLPDGSGRSCWGSFQFDFGALADEARANNPAFDAEDATPWMFTPTSNREIDFFVLKNVAAGTTLTSVQVEMPMDSLVFRDAGGALEQCDGSLRKFSEGDDRVLTFAEAYPSDHCPIVLSLD